MALYGAPVWAEALTAKNVVLLRRPQRAMAVRACRGYRTVSCEAACVLTGALPWDLEAELSAQMYAWRAEQRVRDERLPSDVVRQLKRRARRLQVAKWHERLATPSAGLRTVEAVRPVLKAWLKRKHGSLTFRLTQVLTAHGCFGEYLHRVARREPTPACHHCGVCDVDTAQHTLEECSAWEGPRRALVAEIGVDLSLPTVVAAMVGSERCWQAMVSFCETVISQKEAAERDREVDASAHPCRHRRVGARRRNYLRQMPPP